MSLSVTSWLSKERFRSVPGKRGSGAWHRQQVDIGKGMLRERARIRTIQAGYDITGSECGVVLISSPAVLQNSKCWYSPTVMENNGVA